MEIEPTTSECNVASTSAEVTSPMNTATVPPEIEDFLQTGRTGRRNALPDIKTDKAANFGTGDLPMEMDKLSCSEPKPKPAAHRFRRHLLPRKRSTRRLRRRRSGVESMAQIRRFFCTNVDRLFKRLELEVRGHDFNVLQSYETFVLTAAKHLSIDLVKTWQPWRNIERRPLLRSVFIYKKHREVYERRTYFRCMQFKHLTGSTADTFLEYIERNLPEGVSMKVTKHEIERLPQHLVPPQNDVSEKSDSEQSSVV
ncbi:28S ribosomal protein S10-like protein [Dinothrombium tinctorium]|uniref:Small ribosomal subunit protein uS10m n=1 Tax=Dinothrombium tinctorium TaxID=1965070 RepID=A0A3S3NZL5_9ACAR|nr:28S ribosomal protein S10-like protein [Dinothrombium tinctorium]